MNMRFNEKYNINPEFEDLFAFDSKEEELEHAAKMLMFQFLSSFDKLFEDDSIKKKDIAEAIGSSASYITQLYRGDKIVNLKTLSKLQSKFNFTFEIQAKRDYDSYENEVKETAKLIKFRPSHAGAFGLNKYNDIKDKELILLGGEVKNEKIAL